MTAPQCAERMLSMTAGEVQCDLDAGHVPAHSVHRDGRLVIAWLTHDEFHAAKERGEFDHDYCRCDEPIPVCDDCGGEIL